MASNLSSEFLDCIISFLKLRLSDTLVQAIDEGHQQGKDTKTIIDETLGGLISQAAKAPANQVTISMPATTVVGAAPDAKPSSRKSSPKEGTLLGPDGKALICDAMVQNTKVKCTHPAKYKESDGKCTCGVHHKAYASKTANPDKRPGASNPKAGTSSFQGVVNITGNTSNAFNKIDANDLAIVGDMDDFTQ